MTNEEVYKKIVGQFPFQDAELEKVILKWGRRHGVPAGAGKPAPLLVALRTANESMKKTNRPKPPNRIKNNNNKRTKQGKRTNTLSMWCTSGVDEESAYSNTSSILFSDHSVLPQLNSACSRQETRNICFHWYFIPILWTVLLNFICFNLILKKKKEKSPTKWCILAFVEVCAYKT